MRDIRERGEIESLYYNPEEGDHHLWRKNLELEVALDTRDLIAELLHQPQRRRGTYCAYCGKEFPLDNEAAESVAEHIRTCDKHPLFAANKELAEVMKKLAEHEYLRPLFIRLLRAARKANSFYETNMGEFKPNHQELNAVLSLLAQEDTDKEQAEEGQQRAGKPKPE